MPLQTVNVNDRKKKSLRYLKILMQLITEKAVKISNDFYSLFNIVNYHQKVIYHQNL